MSASGCILEMQAQLEEELLWGMGGGQSM